MRRKLLLTIGLAVLGACLAAGTAGAGRQRRRRRRGRRRRSTFPTATTSTRSRSCRSARTSPTTTATGSPTSTTPTAPARSTRPSPDPAAPAPPTTTPPSPDRRRRRRPTTTTDRRRRTTDDGTKPDGGVGRPDRRPAAAAIGELKPSGERKPGSRGRRAEDERRRAQTGGTAHADGGARRPQPRRHPDRHQPRADRRRLRRRPDRGPELRHRPVHDPALPAADLPGLRNPVRDPLAGARLDQPDRDRLRHQPQRLHRRRAGLDAVHALDLGDVRRRRQRRRPQGPLQPGRRDLRRGPLPERRRRRRTTCAPRSSPTTTPTGTSTRSCSTPTSTASCPSRLVSSLTGLTEGAHFPVAANARYADDISERRGARALEARQGRRRQRRRRDLRLAHTSRDQHLSPRGRPGRRRQRRRRSPTSASPKKLGRYIVLRDAYGNRFTYAELGEVSDVYPVPKESELSAKDFELVTPDDDKAPDEPASAGDPGRRRAGRRLQEGADSADEPTPTDAGPVNTEDARERLYAFPERDEQRRPRRTSPASSTRCSPRRCPATSPSRPTSPASCASTRRRWSWSTLEGGLAGRPPGTVLGRIGKTDELAPHVHFAIRPAGRGAPKIDPKPILDGWKLLEATAIYRAAGKNPFTRHGDAPARCC